MKYGDYIIGYCNQYLFEILNPWQWYIRLVSNKRISFECKDLFKGKLAFEKEGRKIENIQLFGTKVPVWKSECMNEWMNMS